MAQRASPHILRDTDAELKKAFSLYLLNTVSRFLFGPAHTQSLNGIEAKQILMCLANNHFSISSQRDWQEKWLNKSKAWEGPWRTEAMLLLAGEYSIFCGSATCDVPFWISVHLVFKALTPPQKLKNILQKLHSHLYLFLYQLPSLRKLINSFEKCSFDAFQHFLKEICTNDSKSKILIWKRHLRISILIQIIISGLKERINVRLWKNNLKI